MKMSPSYQIAALIGWVVLAACCFVVIKYPTLLPAWGKCVAWTGFVALSLWIVGFWWSTAYSGTGGAADAPLYARNAAFAWRQLLPTLLKVAVQTALPVVSCLLIYKLTQQLGEKALPHLYGIEFDPKWIPNVQVVLPQVVFVASLLAAGLFAVLIVLALVAYGLTSPMFFGSLAGFAIVAGSWAHYAALSCKVRGTLGPMTVQVKEMEDREKRDPALRKVASLDRDTLLSEYRRLVEYRLGTREWNAMVFHRMADEPFGLAFRFPGYLIGVEQANRYLIGVPEGGNLTEEGRKHDGIKALLNDRRRNFVSHIVEFQNRDPGTGKEHDSAPSSEMVQTNMLYNIYESAEYGNAFTRGFTELDKLRKKLDEDLTKAKSVPEQDKDSAAAAAPVAPAAPAAKPYTHILVYCMGWNTDQQESIRNYNSLMGFLAEAAEKLSRGVPFRPLVIGLSWPSEWSYLKPLSYPAKAGDADETGLVWGSYLLKRVLEPLKLRHGIPLVLIGHSFGARVLTRAVASEPDWIKGVPSYKHEMVTAAENDTVSTKIDLFVGLQGAVSANRFVETGALVSGWAEGSPYSGLVKKPTRFIFTWAENDKANPMAAYVTGAHHLGGKIGNEFCLQHLDSFWPVIYKDGADPKKLGAWPYQEPGREYDPRAGWDDSAVAVGGKIFTMDVSSIVKYQPYGKGGGAHSDIYTPEIGRFLWKSILAFAPKRP